MNSSRKKKDIEKEGGKKRREKDRQIWKIRNKKNEKIKSEKKRK